MVNIELIRALACVACFLCGIAHFFFYKRAKTKFKEGATAVAFLGTSLFLAGVTGAALIASDIPAASMPVGVLRDFMSSPHFKEMADAYILIGSTAMNLLCAAAAGLLIGCRLLTTWAASSFMLKVVPGALGAASVGAAALLQWWQIGDTALSVMLTIFLGVSAMIAGFESSKRLAVFALAVCLLDAVNQGLFWLFHLAFENFKNVVLGLGMTVQDTYSVEATIVTLCGSLTIGFLVASIQSKKSVTSVVAS